MEESNNYVQKRLKIRPGTAATTTLLFVLNSHKVPQNSISSESSRCWQQLPTTVSLPASLKPRDSIELASADHSTSVAFAAMLQTALPSTLT
jgi:hypothetical protein